MAIINFFKYVLFILLVILVATIFRKAQVSDPDILIDLNLPQSDPVSSEFFTFTGMHGIFNNNPTNLTITKAALAEFPTLNGLSVSYTVFMYPVGGLNLQHTHPRTSELLSLIECSLEIAFVDTKNVIYNQTLQIGDMFIFPKGLVHYQYNPDLQKPAVAILAFGSASTETISVPVSVFGTGIDDAILAKEFKTDIYTIQKIKAGFNA